MERDHARAEAVAVAGGTILAVGSLQSVLSHQGQGTRVVDLAGRALLPGFIDGHGHIANLASSLGAANLSAPPVGEVVDIESLLETLRRFIRERNIPPGNWVSGRGYDPAFLKEGRHPTRDDLDRVSKEHPIHIGHVSGHLCSANSLALAIAGIGAETTPPPGGVIRRRPGRVEPDGVLEESAMGLLTPHIPLPTDDERLADLEEAQRIYAASGITTAQEGAMFPAQQQLLERAAAEGRLFLDVAGYAFWAQARVMLEGREIGKYHGRYKNAGMKLMLDGSPQGKTAWLTRPYHVIPEGQPADYRGYPSMPDEQAAGLVDRAYASGWPVISHCNGDASADQLIAAVRAAAAAHPGADRRTVMIHAQTVREDQLDAMQELGMLPSFFVSHVYYWGDFHRDSVLGPERAARISPLRSAQRRGLRFNLHNDSPVVPPDVLRLVWCAAARRTRSNQVLGEEQRISVIDALRAVTIDAAYAHFEEDQKGSIAAGKLADLVVLSADPTAVPLEELQAIEVKATLKEGALIHGEL
ncbi:MAG: amidohydrolase [Dehalococcoidia bacterium]